MLVYLLAGVLAMSSGVTVRTGLPSTVFDFDAGVGPEWEVISAFDLFLVSTAGPDVAISKPADDLSIAPDRFISGGILSTFCLVGDFNVTVDFELIDLPITNISMLNESLLGTQNVENTKSFLVLEFASDQQYVEAFTSGTGPIGVQPNAQVAGRYRVSRVDDVFTGEFADAGSEVFATLGSAIVTTEPMRVKLVGVQGFQAGGSTRSATSLDIAFDNLVVDGTIDPACGGTPVVTTPWSALKARFASE